MYFTEKHTVRYTMWVTPKLYIFKGEESLNEWWHDRLLYGVWCNNHQLACCTQLCTSLT